MACRENCLRESNFALVALEKNISFSRNYRIILYRDKTFEIPCILLQTQTQTDQKWQALYVVVTKFTILSESFVCMLRNGTSLVEISSTKPLCWDSVCVSLSLQKDFIYFTHSQGWLDTDFGEKELVGAMDVIFYLLLVLSPVWVAQREHPLRFF